MANTARKIKFNRQNMRFMGKAERGADPRDMIQLQDDQLQLVNECKASALLQLRKILGENSVEVEEAYKVLEDRLDACGNDEDPQLIKLAFIDAYQTDLKRKKSQPIDFDRNKLQFKGYALGTMRFGSFQRTTQATIRVAMEGNVYSWLENTFVEGLNDPVAVKIYRTFVERMRNINADEDPYVLTEALISKLRQFDVFDWRQAGDTLRSETRRRNRVERGDISGKQRKTKTKEDMETELYESAVNFTHGLTGRDVFYPIYIKDADLDQFMILKDVELDVENRIDGKPAMRLSAGDDGAWAIYSLNETTDTWERYFVERVAKIRPLGKDLKLMSSKNRSAVGGEA